MIDASTENLSMQVFEVLANPLIEVPKPASSSGRLGCSILKMIVKICDYFLASMHDKIVANGRHRFSTWAIAIIQRSLRPFE